MNVLSVRRSTALAAVVGAAVVLVAGCSAIGTHIGAPATHTKSHSASKATPGKGKGKGKATKAAKPAGRATRKAVTHAYVTFFSSSVSVNTSVDALQHGHRFLPTLRAQSHSSAGKGLSVRVSKVTLQSRKVANVTFSLLSGKSVEAPDLPGYAVRTHGSWKVAAGTFCTLLTLDKAAPKLCSEAKITSLNGH